MTQKRDHGGGVDAAAARFGGARSDWIDLSTGINPVPYKHEAVPTAAWAQLPDHAAQGRLITAARQFWAVPPNAAILPAPGASALIAQIPRLAPPGWVDIPDPTYNEHAASFASAGWDRCDGPGTAAVRVHPNNPTGELHDMPNAALTVIDESFCDTCPEHSLMWQVNRPGVIILKSFGKFWGLAGLRLGFAIGDPDLIARLSGMLGPWPVSGPALAIGAQALEDPGWASAARRRLQTDATRLDEVLCDARATVLGGTPLFRLYDVEDAAAWQDKLAQNRIWSRIFPYSKRWLRLGLPAPDQWPRLEAALTCS